MAQREPPEPTKVSFSIPKSSSSQRRPPLPRKAPSSSVHAVEYVTSVDAEAGVVLANPQAARGVRVLPKQENSWRPEERMKNIRMEADATRSTEETFEMERMDAGPKPNVVYGLTVMKTRGDDEDGAEGPRRTVSSKELEDQKLRDDLSNLPEEATLETYEELPVEEFGEALFRGMGWEKGKPIGRNAKAVVEPIEFEKRQGTLGLGAVPAPLKEINKKYIKPGESRPKGRADLGAAAIDRSRNAGEPDTKLVRGGEAKVKIVSIIAGPHRGRYGEVVSIDDEGGTSSEVLVKLVRSGERVVVYDDELADVGSFEESAMKKIGELRTANGASEKSQDRHRARTEESRGKTLSENHREDERSSKRSHRRREEENETYSKRSHRHREEEDEMYSKGSHRHREEEDKTYLKRNHRHREEEDDRYSKRGHGHHEEGDDRYAKRVHRHSEGEDERYAKRGHRRSGGDRRSEGRGHKDRSERR